MEKIRLAVADFKAAAPPCRPWPQPSTTRYGTIWRAPALSRWCRRAFTRCSSRRARRRVTAGRLGQSAAQCGHGGFRQFDADGQKLDRAGLALRRRRTRFAPGSGQAIPRAAHARTARATAAHKFADEIIFRLGGGIPGHRRKQDRVHLHPQRPQRSLGDGLRWRQPAPDHPSGRDRPGPQAFAGRLAHRLLRPERRQLGNHDVLAGC